MLREWKEPVRPGEEELKMRLAAAREKLAAQQLLIKEQKVPVLVLLEGWGTAGKGYCIGQIIENIDPRHFKVESMERKTGEEERKPFLYRHFTRIPEAGKFVFLDSGWMDEVVEERLTDEKDTVWRVGKKDLWQNSHYEKCMDAFSSYLKSTNMPSAPWYIVDAKSKKWTELQVLETLTQGIDIALDNRDMAVPLLQNVFPLERMPLLSEIPLDKTLDEETYRKELKHLKQRLGELHNRLYRKKVPVIIAYEGWDAAGKGGNIKRITSALDPRGYEVHPIASPEPHEKARHYLWRFWTRLPKTGHIAIFDRSWYGRVMVERLEGFCTENDWMRAYNEINEFEKELHDWGAVIIKFWVQIDKDTQLERFNERQNTPEKQWKITEEDWRNREKWDQYETAVNEMITKTSTTYAPWHILESVDKKYARIKALRIVIEELEKALD